VPSASEFVVIVGGGTTVIVTEADFVLSLTEVAVSVTPRFAATLAGAL
jgi:hypothetical protein